MAEVIRDTNINLALVEYGKAFAYRQYVGGRGGRSSLLFYIPWRTSPDHKASSHRQALAITLVGNPPRM